MRSTKGYLCYDLVHQSHASGGEHEVGNFRTSVSQERERSAMKQATLPTKFEAEETKGTGVW